MALNLDSEGPLGPIPSDRERKEAAEIQEELEAQRRALNFLRTVAVNLDNEKLDDTEFREFMRNSMEGMLGIDYTKP